MNKWEAIAALMAPTETEFDDFVQWLAATRPDIVRRIRKLTASQMIVEGASGAPGRDATGWTDKEIQVAADRACDASGVGGFLNTPEWLRLFLRELGASRGLPVAPPETFDPRPLGRQLADDIREILDVAAPRFEYTGEELAKRGWRRARTALGEGRPE